MYVKYATPGCEFQCFKRGRWPFFWAKGRRCPCPWCVRGQEMGWWESYGPREFCAVLKPGWLISSGSSGCAIFFTLLNGNCRRIGEKIVLWFAMILENVEEGYIFGYHLSSRWIHCLGVIPRKWKSQAWSIGVWHYQLCSVDQINVILFRVYSL